MITEQTLQERIMERAIGFLPKWLQSVVEGKLRKPGGTSRMLFDAFMQAAMEEMVDKHEVEKWIAARNGRCPYI
jgi:hypothetical protein